MRTISALIGLLTALAAGLEAGPATGQTAPRPRYPGAGTTVAVERTSGRLAVVQGTRLMVFDSVSAAAPAVTVDLPGKDPRVLECRGATILYLTLGLPDLPRAFVALTADGRERLAWPNEGLSEVFPGETTRLTLDGRGISGAVPLDQPAREFFGIGDDIPMGATVAASYRFAGEKLLARASDAFKTVVALAPDDMVITLRRGGLLRSRPGGIAWQLDAESGAAWTLLDVETRASTALLVNGRGALVAVDLDVGAERWHWSPLDHSSEIGALAVPLPAPVRPAGAEPVPPPQPSPRTLGTTWAATDARLLTSGRVLVRLAGPRPALAVLDPTTGRMGVPDVVAAAVAAGLGAQLAGFLAGGETMSELFEVASGAGPALLFKAGDGWYLLPLGAPR
jgi:hypothetical protein